MWLKQSLLLAALCFKNYSDINHKNERLISKQFLICLLILLEFPPFHMQCITHVL